MSIRDARCHAMLVAVRPRHVRKSDVAIEDSQKRNRRGNAWNEPQNSHAATSQVEFDIDARILVLDRIAAKHPRIGADVR